MKSKREKKKYSKEWLNEKEINQLFETPGISSRDLMMMRTCYFGAFRISEVLNIKLEDIRLEDYSFILLREQKTDKKNWEKQPIPKKLYSELMRYCEDNKIRLQDYIFPSRQSAHLTYIRAYQIVKECVQKAGINKDITTHTFRRSRGTNMLENGLDIIRVMEFLRHKNLETTRKYLKLAKKKLYLEMEKIDKKAIYDIL